LNDFIDNNLKLPSLLGILIYLSGCWIVATEIVLKLAQLYSPYELDITIYLKSLILTITGLTGALVFLFNFLGIGNFPNIDENNELKRQKIVKISIPIFVVLTLFYMIGAFQGFDLFRITFSMAISSIGFILIYTINKIVKNNKSSLYLTGNMLLALGALLLLNECIIIVLRWMLGISNMTWLDMIYWIANFTFVNTYPKVEVYLDVFSISVIISISLATIIVAKKIRRNTIANNNKINEIEKLISQKNKIKIIKPRRKKR